MEWTSGYWFWEGSEVGRLAMDPVDILYVQTGTLRRDYAGQWEVGSSYHDRLPEARAYWAVIRCEGGGVPPAGAARKIAESYQEIARDHGLNDHTAAGLQLDIDAPTRSLAEYAAFLAEVKSVLPPKTRLSITALLDWFRPGTDVAKVIGQVDEFVPQFYDNDMRQSGISAPVDAARWGPVFNHFGKRFRVGISTFGRSRTKAARTVPVGGNFQAVSYRDLRPLDVALRPEFTLESQRTAAAELILRYRAKRQADFGERRVAAGDVLEFISATPESVRTATDAARRMGGNIAGVVYFRWPGRDETLTLDPMEVRAAVSGTAPDPVSVTLIDGHCAAVGCADLFLNGAAPFRAETVRYRIRSSSPMEYFLPEAGVPVRMTGPDTLTVSLPPYCARGLLFLGRVVTTRQAKFRVEEAQ